MKVNGNDIFIMIITITVVLLILLTFIVSFLFMYKSRQTRHHAEMKSVEEKYNQELLQAQLEIREQTLKNIAEEIHDNVGQVLSLAVLNLSAIEVSDSIRAADKIEQVTGLVEKAVRDLRNLSKTMDADNIALQGLKSVIKFELELLEKTGLYQTRLTIKGEERRLQGEKEIILYRIVQEALNNIMKHAAATVVKIELRFNEHLLELEISDNGKGFIINPEKEQTLSKSGAGIKNMRKRSMLIGGNFDLQSIPFTGTNITISLPYLPHTT